MSELDLALLGSRIRAVRKDRGLTQQELAHQTGLSVKTVRDIERGRKNPSYETVIRLLNRLGILLPNKNIGNMVLQKES